MTDDIRRREREGSILVYRRPERRPHRILRSADGVTWKAISGEFNTLEDALHTIKRLHRWYGDRYQWCAERIATGDRTGLVFKVEDDDTPQE